MPKEIILEPLKVLMGGFNKQVRFRAKTQGDRVNSTSEDNNRKQLKIRDDWISTRFDQDGQ